MKKIFMIFCGLLLASFAFAIDNFTLFGVEFEEGKNFFLKKENMPGRRKYVFENNTTYKLDMSELFNTFGDKSFANFLKNYRFYIVPKYAFRPQADKAVRGIVYYYEEEIYDENYENNSQLVIIAYDPKPYKINGKATGLTNTERTLIHELAHVYTDYKGCKGDDVWIYGIVHGPMWNHGLQCVMEDCLGYEHDSTENNAILEDLYKNCGE